MADTLKRYLSVKQICERLPVRKSLIYRLVRDGGLASTRLGNKILVAEEDLIALLAKGEPKRADDETDAPVVEKRRSRRPLRTGKIELW